MEKYRPPSPYIEHVFHCSITGADPHPDAKRYERMLFWDEIMEDHVRSTEAALRMSQALEDAIRQNTGEHSEKEGNQETNVIKTGKEE